MRQKNQYDNQYWYVYVTYDNWFVIKQNPHTDIARGPFTNIKHLKKDLLPKLRAERDLIIKQIGKLYTLKNGDI